MGCSQEGREVWRVDNLGVLKEEIKNEGLHVEGTDGPPGVLVGLGICV